MKKYDIMRTPQNDIIFKRLFAKKGNEEFLTEFLEQILNIKILSIEIHEEASLPKEIKSVKGGRIDLKTIVNGKEIIDVEMQVENNDNIIDRSLNYGSKLFFHQLSPKDKYADSNPVILINILSYEHYKDGKYLISGRMRRDDNYKTMSDKIQMYIIQLPTFLKTKNIKKSKLTDWLYFLSQKNKEGLKMAIDKNEKVERAQKQLQEFLADPETRAIWDLKEKAEMERKFDLADEHEKGRKEGRKEERIKIAKNLLESGMDIEQIKKMTDLSIEEINELKEKVEI